MADQDHIKKLIQTFEEGVILAVNMLHFNKDATPALEKVDKAREALLEAYKRKC